MPRGKNESISLRAVGTITYDIASGRYLGLSCHQLDHVDMRDFIINVQKSLPTLKIKELKMRFLLCAFSMLAIASANVQAEETIKYIGSSTVGKFVSAAADVYRKQILILIRNQKVVVVKMPQQPVRPISVGLLGKSEKKS